MRRGEAAAGATVTYLQTIGCEDVFFEKMRSRMPPPGWKRNMGTCIWARPRVFDHFSAFSLDFGSGCPPCESYRARQSREKSSNIRGRAHMSLPVIFSRIKRARSKTMRAAQCFSGGTRLCVCPARRWHSLLRLPVSVSLVARELAVLWRGNAAVLPSRRKPPRQGPGAQAWAAVRDTRDHREPGSAGASQPLFIMAGRLDHARPATNTDWPAPAEPGSLYSRGLVL
eukprot:gene9624-biopygen16735